MKAATSSICILTILQIAAAAVVSTSDFSIRIDNGSAPDTQSNMHAIENTTSLLEPSLPGPCTSSGTLVTFGDYSTTSTRPKAQIEMFARSGFRATIAAATKISNWWDVPVPGPIDFTYESLGIRLSADSMGSMTFTNVRAIFECLDEFKSGWPLRQYVPDAQFRVSQVGHPAVIGSGRFSQM